MKRQLIDRSLVQDKVCQNTYNALKGLIDNCYYSQLLHPYYRKDVDTDGIAYINEFCTVKMCTARQSGHTTAMCKVIQEYFNKAIILSPRTEMSKRTINCFGKGYVPSVECVKITSDEIVTKDGRYLFGTYSSYDSMYKFRGYSCEAVFIDGTFDLTEAKKNEVICSFSPCMSCQHQKFFVYIQ